MFAEGDEVMARHPASLDYDKGRVVAVKTNSYRIRFYEGDEYNVAVNDVKVTTHCYYLLRAHLNSFRTIILDTFVCFFCLFISWLSTNGTLS